MIEWIYIPLIFLLYLRTYKYNNLLDDNIPRSGMLWVVNTESTPVEFADRRKSWLATVTNLGHFIATCFAVHMVFGWKAALLYSVLPTNVCGVAWNTGNYYMATSLMIAITHYFATHLSLAGTMFAAMLYVTALGTTVAAIPYAFYIILTDPRWVNLIFFLPLLAFLFGKRFTTALKLRKAKHEDMKNFSAGVFKINRIFWMVKVMGYYIFLNVWPSRLGFFHDFYKDENVKGELVKPTKQFWLFLALNVLFFIFAWAVNWKMCLWWFLFIGVFSQYVTFSQDVAERYMFVANVGFCVIAAMFITNPVIFAILATLWACRTWAYVPAYRNNKHLFWESISAFPKAPENYNNLGSWYVQRGQWLEAAKPLLSALKLTQSAVLSTQIHANLSLCYIKSGMFSSALYHTKAAMVNCPGSKKQALIAQETEIHNRMVKIEKDKKYLRKAGII